MGLGLSGLIAGGSIAGMIYIGLRTAPPDNRIVIAEPASISLEPASPAPAVLIDVAYVDVIDQPVGKRSSRLSLITAPLELGDMLKSEKPAPGEVLDEMPVPRRRPLEGVKFASTSAGLQVFSDDAGDAVSLPGVKNYGNWPKDAVAKAREKCERLLKGLDVKFKPKDPIGASRSCGIAYPLSVSAIAGVAVTPPATLNCEMVAAVHTWITQVAQPTAKQQFNTRLTGLQNASSYACRRRNNSSTGKLSEHAFGNAFDISEFRFSNRLEASVAGGWSGSVKGLSLGSRGKFFKQTRSGACKYFNTVLGPGSDPFHKDHYHLDLMKLRKGRGKYCR
jgi:hypothetical protein